MVIKLVKKLLTANNMHYFLNTLRLLLVVICMSIITCGDANERANDRWMKSKNLKEFQSLVELDQKLQKIKTLCILQLNRKKIPTYCYQWLNNQNLPVKKKVQGFLDEKCQEFLKNLKNLDTIEYILQNFNLPPPCKNPLRDRKKMLEYQLRDQAPKKLLKWYFKSQF